MRALGDVHVLRVVYLGGGTVDFVEDIVSLCSYEFLYPAWLAICFRLLHSTLKCGGQANSSCTEGDAFSTVLCSRLLL